MTGPDRLDLVARLKAMTEPEVAAYCTAVLTIHTGRDPNAEPHPISARIIDLRPNFGAGHRCCDICDGPLPIPSRVTRRYCGNRCQQAAYRRRVAA